MIEKTYQSFDPAAGIGTDYALIAGSNADCVDLSHFDLDQR
ncbi:MAG TPA: hypothetical protein VNN81_11770 [Bradyrhizobium sp.]|nr:hypothetical protein [Bradyrhizobium sp.]